MAERNHGSMPVTWASRSTGTPRRNRASTWKMRSGVADAATSSSPSVLTDS
jgi:hypothetical protein